MIALGLLCLAVMAIALGSVIPTSRVPWLWGAIAAVLALAGALVALGVISV